MTAKRLNTFTSLAALIFFGCLALISKVALAANMDQSMAAQFNAMINVTPAGTYETQAAKVISGGGFVYRPRVAQLRLLAIDPPRLRADCNGIDAYAGSLSFISKDAFINFLRNLSGAAPAYAFNMALSYLCKDCDQHLARLQKLAQDVNALTINSCKIDSGELMKKVSTIGKDIDDVSKSGKELGAHFASLYNDAFGARQPDANPAGQVQDAAAAGNPTAIDAVARINVNIAALAAKDSALSDWWGAALGAADKRQFNEVMMSFTGTITTITTPTVEDPAQKKDKTYFLPALLKFSEFMNGADTIEVYKCPDDSCLIMPDSPKQTVTIPSYYQMVTDLLIGTSAAPGIIFRLNSRSSTGGSALTQPEKDFITALPGGVYAHLRELAIYPSSAATYAKTLSQWLAAEMTYEYLAQIIRNARVASGQTKAEHLKREYIESLDKIEMQIISDRVKHSDSVRTVAANLTIAAHMRENLSRATAVGLRPGAFGPSN
jgi:conjugative transfer pilus assembly protein TraH